LRKALFLFFASFLAFCQDARVKSISQEKAHTHNDSLIKLLDSILVKDQLYRSDTLLIRKQIQLEYDRENLKAVKSIFNKYGWPGPDLIGKRGSITILMVIQHSDIKTQREYLPLVRQAVIEGKLDGKSWVLLEDRVSLANTGKQIYGTQVEAKADRQWYIPPIIDEKNLDKRRQALGLEKMETYVSYWGIDYKLPQ
jgi:hypothetical protein